MTKHFALVCLAGVLLASAMASECEDPEAECISVAPADDVEDWKISGSTVLATSLIMVACMGALFYVQGPLPVALGDGTTPKKIHPLASCCGLSVFGLIALFFLFNNTFVIQNPEVAQGPMTTTPMTQPDGILFADFNLINVYIIDNPNMFSFDIIDFDVKITWEGRTLATLKEEGPFKFGAGIVTQLNMVFPFRKLPLLDLGLTTLGAGGVVTLKIEGGFKVFGGGVVQTTMPIDVTSDYSINVFGGEIPDQDNGDGGEGGDGETAAQGDIYGDPPKAGKDIWTASAFIFIVVAVYGGTVFYNMNYLNRDGTTPAPIIDDKPELLMGYGGGQAEPDAMTQASGVTRSRGSRARSKGSRASGGRVGSSGGRRSNGSGKRRSKGSRGSRSRPMSTGSQGSQGTYGGTTVGLG